jgi:PPOX class probable F420-dependent enzyme
MANVPLEPTASRPRFAPGYGVPESSEGMLPWSWAEARLESARNYWIGTSRGDGSPHAAPVWGLWIGDAVLFSTSPNSRKGRNLARDPRVVVHLESGDEVVIVEGEVERVALDEASADAYEAKYAFRPDPDWAEGLWYAVRPRLAYAWLESGYPRTATRFAFD